MDLLAILGRGIQLRGIGEPWVLTEDLEVCDGNSAHLPVRVPADDENPFCMIGGGEINLLAGIALMRKHQPKVMVCAYGDRSTYLKSVDGPSESEVMSGAFRFAINGELQSLNPDSLEIVVWPASRSLPGPSNTNRELQNVFELAVERGFTSVGIVTVSVHLPRALLQAQRHLMKPEFRSLENGVQVFTSEEVLLEANSKYYGPRLNRMFASQAYQRNWLRELEGIRKILAGTYKDEKPRVVHIRTPFIVR